MTYTFRYLIVFLSLLLLQTGVACAGNQRQVVVYTALDQIFSEPILKEFEAIYKIKVNAVYDIEAVKTTGMVNRLIAEKANPRCDVFWNNEIMRTITLKRKGILQPYSSPSAKDIPEQFKDKDGYWAGFAARARILVVNTNLVKKQDYPTSINDLTAEKWRGQTAMANPLFGTTSTHVAALFASQGQQDAETYLANVLANEVKIVDGNSVVRDMTANGEVLFGITDTDDANVGIVSGMPISMIVPDQDGQQGALLIPNTVALINNAPHPEEAKLLLDFLLSRAVEEKLAKSSSAQIPLRKGIASPIGQLSINDFIPLKVDYEKMADIIEQSVKTVQHLFMR
jgi:iron(III) transport system substrate-binding protein